MQTKEPEYQGRKLSEWLVDFEGNMTDQQEREAAFALRKMGSKSLDYLVDQIDADPRRWSYRMRVALLAKFGLSFRAKDNSSAACAALIAMDTDAYPAIPALVSKLGVVRNDETLIVLVLKSMGAAAVPELSRALNSPSDVMKYRAMIVLRLIGRDAVKAIPELMEIRKVPRFKVWADAALESIAPKLAEELGITNDP